MAYAEIYTAKGKMKVELYDDDAPLTVDNFIRLVKEGFYDGLAFHRVIRGFMIQTGCPYSREIGDRLVGTGGPGYTIKCETGGKRQHHDRGILSMAHHGRDTGGSQFFICYNREQTQHLDGEHTVFGRVIEGNEVIDKIKKWDRIERIVIV